MSGHDERETAGQQQGGGPESEEESEEESDEALSTDDITGRAGSSGQAAW